MSAVVNLKGKQFGRLTVLERAAHIKSRRAFWYCKCACGRRKIVKGELMMRGKTRSCGCLEVEARHINQRTHGRSRTPEHYTWQNMKKRCDPNHASLYPRYAGRGIKVCERWSSSFENFIADMGCRPSPKHTIERIDNDGNYEPSNCKWATRKEQGRNQCDNHLLTYNGETYCIAEWAERIGVEPYVLKLRLKRDWPIERVLTAPLRTRDVTHNGESRSLPEWARIAGIKPCTLRYRLKHGWSFDSAISKTVRAS